MKKRALGDAKSGSPCITLTLKAGINHPVAAKFARKLLEISGSSRADIRLFEPSTQEGQRFFVSVCGGPLVNPRRLLNGDTEAFLTRVQREIQTEIELISFRCL